MSVTEALGEGVMVTVAGLIIVFSVLIILMLVMMAMKKIFYKEPEKTETKADEVQKTVSQQEQPPEEQPTEDPNLIAVLAAAVAASLNTCNRFKILNCDYAIIGLIRVNTGIYQISLTPHERVKIIRLAYPARAREIIRKVGKDYEKVYY